MKNLRALVASNDKFARIELATILSGEFRFEQIIEASSFDEAIDQINNDINLALFDLDMPGMNNAAGLSVVRAIYPAMRVTVIAESARREDMLRGLDAGIHGFFLKAHRGADLVAAIRTVLDGYIFVPSCFAELPA